MKIDKYKYKRNGEYEVFIGNNKYIIYEDIIIKNNLLSKKEITDKELNKYLEDNKYYEAYYKCIKYINTKLRTQKEIRDYLQKNEFDSNLIKDVIKKLKDDKYLDDDIYSKAYIHDQIILKMIGPYKIKKDLLKLGINADVINSNLNVYTKEIEFEKLNRLIPKQINSNKNKSSYVLKNKVLNDMINKGFTKEYIEYVLENQSFDDSEIYKKEYDKLCNKLSKKYSGNQLEYKIKEKLYQKGFRKN